MDVAAVLDPPLVFNVTLFLLWCVIINFRNNLIAWNTFKTISIICRSSHQEIFLVKGVLKICSKFTGEHPCQSVILIKLLCNFIEITVRHGCFPVNLLQIFRTSFLKNTRGWLVLHLFHVFIAYLCFYNACNFMICDLRSKGGMDQLTFLHEIIVIILICYYQIQYVL